MLRNCIQKIDYIGRLQDDWYAECRVRFTSCVFKSEKVYEKYPEIIKESVNFEDSVKQIKTRDIICFLENRRKKPKNLSKGVKRWRQSCCMRTKSTKCRGWFKMWKSLLWMINRNYLPWKKQSLKINQSICNLVKGNEKTVIHILKNLFGGNYENKFNWISGSVRRL